MKRYQACVEKFCEVMGPWEQAASSRGDRVQAFMIWAKDCGKSHSWMAGHLSAIGHHAKLLRQEDPTALFTTRAALKGSARVVPKSPEQRAPIDYETLQGMLEALPSVAQSAYEASLFASTFSLAFFGAFRIGELVARSKTETNPRALQMRDVRLTADSVEILLQFSKTDQAGRGRGISVHRLGNDRYCPVALLAAFLASRPHADGLLLIHLDGSPVTKFQTLQTEDKKMVSTKNLVDVGLGISLLLLATLIARIILYSTVTARAQLTQEKLAQLESNLSLAMKYIGCKERTSGTDCGQLFYWACPTDWLPYNGKCYFFSKNKLSWDKSRLHCLTSQADLLIINDRMEQLFISNTTKPDFLWIGLTDRDKEGVWKWVNGLRLQSEAFWDCKQPDNFGNVEDCATLGSIRPPCRGTSSLWNDDYCDNVYKFICEKEAEDRKMDFTP
ncbi:uncharacterized protein LOC144798176 [Lissotriton helveticus]